jgi:cytochrome c biogenesis protein CcdA
VSLASQAFNFDPGIIRMAGALLLLLFGVVSLVPASQEMLSRLVAPLASRASTAAARKDKTGLGASFFAGSLLGAIWSPCAGPTLGAAMGLATQARTAIHGFLVMFTFGLGTSVPLLAVAYGSRSLFQAKKGWLVAVSGKAKLIFGVMLIFVAVGIMTGWDKKLEALALRHLPESWIDLTIRY